MTQSRAILKAEHMVQGSRESQARKRIKVLLAIRRYEKTLAFALRALT